MPRRIKYMIVTAMKNEGPYILEWVAHHLALGFEHMVVVTNDCDDGTTRILDRLAELGHVTHVPNPKMLNRSRGVWQVTALRYARLLNIVRDAEWVLHSDVDEFVQLQPPLATLDALFDALGPTDVLSFTSMPFSSSGKHKLEDAPVVSQFTKYSKDYSTARAAGTPVLNAVKTMFRNDVPFRLRRNHRPVLEDFSARNLTWRNGSGTVLAADFTDGTFKAMNALDSVGLAQLNHYAIRSVEAFLVKLDRGDVAGTDRLDNALKYWRSYDQPGDDERTWARPTDACKNLYTRLRDDPELGPLHQKAYAIHKEKVDRILQTEDGQRIAEALGYSGT